MDAMEATRRAVSSSRIGLVLLVACFVSMLLLVGVLVRQY